MNETTSNVSLTRLIHDTKQLIDDCESILIEGARTRSDDPRLVEVAWIKRISIRHLEDLEARKAARRELA